MKRLLFLSLLFTGLFSCSDGEPKDALTHESVRYAAQKFYGMLIRGEYDQFIDGMAGHDSIPEDMRRQLVNMLAQFAHQQQERKGGIISAVAVDDSLRDSVGLVFMELMYGDSTREQVSVPMVMMDKRWKMK